MSHVALQFEGDDYLYHAYGTKIHKDTAHDFHAKYNLVDFVKIPMSPSDEIKVRDSFIKSIWYEKYDKKAFLYFAWDLFKLKFFGKKQSTRNPWNSNDDMICTEVVYLVEEFYQEVTGKYLLPDDVDLSITKPGQLCSLLKSRFAS